MSNQNHSWSLASPTQPIQPLQPLQPLQPDSPDPQNLPDPQDPPPPPPEPEREPVFAERQDDPAQAEELERQQDA